VWLLIDEAHMVMPKDEENIALPIKEHTHLDPKVIHIIAIKTFFRYRAFKC
jgi:hypothetical protein